MAEGIAESEYSGQYFGFTPEVFFQQYCELVLDEMSSIFQQSINQVSLEENKDVLIKNTLEIHKRWTGQSEHVLKELQPAIKEFFTIPKTVLLPCDEIHVVQYTEEDNKKLEKEVEELKAKYVEELSSVQMYKIELDVLEKLDPIMRKVDEGIDIMNKFEAKLNEIKELEKLAETFDSYKKMYDEKSDPDNYRIHEKKFVLE